MKKYLLWFLLASVPLTLAVLEGVFENLPQRLIQFNGLLIILITLGLIVWTLISQLPRFRRPDHE